MEEQELVIVKDSFLTKIANAFKKIFSRGKDKELLLKEGDKKETKNKADVELISRVEPVQLEIMDARRAYRKYVINNAKNLTEDVFNYIQNKIFENENEIKKIIEVNSEDISFNDILDYMNAEEKNISNFKHQNKKTGRYNVPVGVIGIECDNSKDAIKAIFKAISTRNAIIVLHDNYNKYSTEALVLLIVKECLKNFYIDDNIIQMFSKEEIDVNLLDKVICKDGQNENKVASKTIYIYQEDESFNESVQNEIERLQNNDLYKSYEIKPIKGDFGNVINYFDNIKESASAICMYTNNDQRAYKFINWINTPNVFVNTGIKSLGNSADDKNCFYNSKFVLHEDVF